MVRKICSLSVVEEGLVVYIVLA